MGEDHTYTHLLAPGRIGALDLRNRIVMAPMGDLLANADGTVSDNQLAYFEARARGGAGLLLVGSISVAYPSGAYDDRQTAASDDSFLPGLADLTARAHRHGARIAAQLTHNGGFASYTTPRDLLCEEEGDSQEQVDDPRVRSPGSTHDSVALCVCER